MLGPKAPVTLPRSSEIFHTILGFIFDYHNEIWHRGAKFHLTGVENDICFVREIPNSDPLMAQMISKITCVVMPRPSTIRDF